MIQNKAYTNYRTANVNTTDQGKLILICYDVAIKSCMQAIELMDAKDPAEKAKKLYKAQDAVTELMVALDKEKGGEFAVRLFALYDYFNWRLSEANLKQDVKMIKEVLNHLKELRSAWVIAIEKTRKEQSVDLNRAPSAGSLKLVG